jgi:hypothetical protein
MGIAVVRDAGIELKVEIAGGKAPYKYQWFKGGVAIAGQLGQYNFYSDTADSYSKEGLYYVEISDGNGNSLRSESAQVAISDEGTNCPAGSYYTFENAQYDTGTNYFTEYFNGPRGKFLLHQSFDKYGAVYGVAAKYPVRTTFTVSSDIAYRGATYISCRTNIPRIHAPTKNPGYTSGTTSDQYADGFNYKYEGQVSFECRDRKLLFKADTCKWNYYKPANTGGSSR